MDWCVLLLKNNWPGLEVKFKNLLYTFPGVYAGHIYRAFTQKAAWRCGRVRRSCYLFDEMLHLIHFWWGGAVIHFARQDDMRVAPGLSEEFVTC